MNNLVTIQSPFNSPLGAFKIYHSKLILLVLFRNRYWLYEI